MYCSTPKKLGWCTLRFWFLNGSGVPVRDDVSWDGTLLAGPNLVSVRLVGHDAS